MRNLVLTTTLLVALLCFVSLPILTVGVPNKLWPKPSEQLVDHHHNKGSSHLGNSKLSLDSSSSLDSDAPLPAPGLRLPNIPLIPNIPDIPLIPAIPNIPQIPNIPAIPQIPSLPDLPNLPGLPDLPDLPNLPGLPSLPDLPTLPGLPSLPDLPELPDLPSLPALPKLPSLPKLPGLPPLPRVKANVLLQSDEVQNCLKKDGSNISEKCFSQISSSWTKKDFALDKECCEIIVNMDKKCNRHVHKVFKSPFFVSLLRYSCQLNHTKN